MSDKDPKKTSRIGRVCLVLLVLLAVILAIPEFFPQLGIPELAVRQSDEFYEDRLRGIPLSLGLAVIALIAYKLLGRRR